MGLGSEAGDDIVESWFAAPTRGKASGRDKGSKKGSRKGSRALPPTTNGGRAATRSKRVSRDATQGAERGAERTAGEADHDHRAVKSEELSEAASEGTLPPSPPPPPSPPAATAPVAAAASDAAPDRESRRKRSRSARDGGDAAEPSPSKKKKLSADKNKKLKREADKTKEETPEGGKRRRRRDDGEAAAEKEADGDGDGGKTAGKKPERGDGTSTESAKEQRRRQRAGGKEEEEERETRRGERDGGKEEERETRRSERDGCKTRKTKRDSEQRRQEEAERQEEEQREVKPDAKRAKTKKEQASDAAAKRKKIKEEEENAKWKWWEEKKHEDGVKWTFLEHKGPLFSPQYEPLPATVNFYYDGKAMKLSVAAEEVASFFAKMLEHEYTTRDVFRTNFFRDWRKEMTKAERKTIKNLDKCNFNEMLEHFNAQQEARKNMTKEEKKELKLANEVLLEEYGYCSMDGHRERIGNFRVEPPGLFRGRGDHPKQGTLKLRLQPENVIINCSADAKVPEPPAGHRWKEVRHDGTVSWLASWTENVQQQIKYVMLNASSRVKGEKDWQKYEVARELKGCVVQIREQYRLDWKSHEMRVRQCAVALYFIDKLALRAGNEKDEGEADTVGCCSLRLEHVRLHKSLDGQDHVVEFDFLGKDSIRYYNKVPVDKRVFKNLQLFMENKCPGDELFDRLNTLMLNKHLQTLMDGLSAKVFRTYNASITLQEQLAELTREDDSVAAKILSYNRANRSVAILCNHQRTPPKTYEQSMANLQAKVSAKQEQLSEARIELEKAKVELKENRNVKTEKLVEMKQKAMERIEQQLDNMEVAVTNKEENKQIALGTSKLNYLDPRISVAWCKKFGVPIEKIYNKTQRDKFAWAIAMVDKDFVF